MKFLLILILSLSFNFWSEAELLKNPISGYDILTNQKVSHSLDSVSKATVLVFLSARCPCSASHENALNILSKEYSEKEIKFIGIHSNVDESLEFAQKHFNSSKLRFQILRDEKSHWANYFGALKTPHVFILSPQGDIMYQGGIDDSSHQPDAQKHYLKNALNNIKVGKKPDPSSTRTLGCVIQRS